MLNLITKKQCGDCQSLTDELDKAEIEYQAEDIFIPIEFRGATGGAQKVVYMSPKTNMPIFALPITFTIPPDGFCQDIYYFDGDFTAEEAAEFLRQEAALTCSS